MKIIEVNTQEEVAVKQTEIQLRVDEYKAAQDYQNGNGGPGPVADYEIMSIVNEHKGQFTVVVKITE